METRELFVDNHSSTCMVSRVQHISFYARTSPTPPVDRHGKQLNPHATEITIRQQIHEHLKSFSTVQSHYGRAKKTKGRKYFSSYMSIATMYELYLQNMKLKNTPWKKIESFILHMNIIVNILIFISILDLVFLVLILDAINIKIQVNRG